MLDQIKTIGLLGALALLMIAMGNALGPGYLEFFLLMALVTNVGAYFFSDKLALSMHGAQELSRGQAPELFAMVEELSQRAEIPAPRIYRIPSATPNAFATGRNPSNGAVAVTDGLLQHLSGREVRAVLAHELGHIANRDIFLSTVAAVLAGVIASLASAARWGMMFGGPRRRDDEGGGGLGVFVLMLLAPVAATVIQLGVSRTREFLADEAGARISGDPEALASALLRLESIGRQVPMQSDPATAALFIVRPREKSIFEKLFSTHPATEERVARLRAMR